MFNATNSLAALRFARKTPTTDHERAVMCVAADAYDALCTAREHLTHSTYHALANALDAAVAQQDIEAIECVQRFVATS